MFHTKVAHLGESIFSSGEVWLVSRLAPFKVSAGALSESKSHCDWRSVSLSWRRAPAGAHDQMFLLVWKLLSCPCGASSLTRGWVCHLSVIVVLTMSVLTNVLCDFPPAIIVEWLAYQLHNEEVPGSSLTSETDYPYESLSFFLSVPWVICWR
jgi:hypothetical protein